MTGVAKGTVLKLLVNLGRACADYQDKALHDLPCKRIQTDEIWAFVGAKEKNVPVELRGVWGHGDVWTFVTLCADTKLAVSWLLGTRDTGTATEHMQDVAGRLSRRVQLTTDGHKMYLAAVEDAFGADIDFSQLVKVYGTAPEAEKRYSPPEVIGAKKDKINGHPDPAHVSTSYVERQNLTMRMSMRRFTRLTNAFSKKVENLAAAVALHFMWYNFGRVHQTLRVTPAMEAKVTDHVWTLEGIIGLLEAQEISDRAAASN
jgi:IS1 family transposase